MKPRPETKAKTDMDLIIFVTLVKGSLDFAATIKAPKDEF
jgi:hypothetical protein